MVYGVISFSEYLEWQDFDREKDKQKMIGSNRFTAICLPFLFLFSCAESSSYREREVIKWYVIAKWKNGNPNVIIEHFDREGKEYRKKVFSPDSILVHSKEFRSDTLHGYLIRYYPSGQKRTETEYVMGRKNGLSRGWFESGKERFRNIFQNDTLVATESYYENGQREADLNLKNGLLDSVATYYTSEGFISMKGQWEKSLKTGIWQIYGEDSQLQYYAYYNKGVLERIDTLALTHGPNP